MSISNCIEADKSKLAASNGGITAVTPVPEVSGSLDASGELKSDAIAEINLNSAKTKSADDVLQSMSSAEVFNLISGSNSSNMNNSNNSNGSAKIELQQQQQHARTASITAPRMSNAFARKLGLNPKDSPVINLQKITNSGI